MQVLDKKMCICSGEDSNFKRSSLSQTTQLLTEVFTAAIWHYTLSLSLATVILKDRNIPFQIVSPGDWEFGCRRVSEQMSN